jgi:sigma-54 dependent transcriptional regulator
MHALPNSGTSSTLAPLFIDARSRRIISQLERVAPSEASIFIVGETGTGKEVIAQQVHRRSGRSGPFVAVNCGALSETLGEAALFGHEAGAYTGASGARAGWFEAANGGTLFLDEIGDLPLALQVALLRVLQERQVVRLGSRKSQPIDVRVIAATNIDVGEAVRNGKFRLDLYFRLSVVTIELPALRERSADILPLAEHFIRVYGEKLQRPLPTLDAEAKRALLAYSWPGNVRELENVIHGAVLVAGETIQRGDLRLVPWISAIDVPGPRDRDVAARVEHSPLEGLTGHLDQLFGHAPEQLMENLESLLVARALAFCNGNQVHTAKLLGITRNVLRTYLKRFGLLSSSSGSGRSSRSPSVVPTIRSARGFARHPLQYHDAVRGELA